MSSLELLRSGPVLIAGAGVSGAGSAAMVRQLGATDLYIADDNADRGQAVAAANNATWLTTEQAIDFLPQINLVVTSPGWAPHTPLLAAATEAGISVIGDVQVAWEGDQAGRFGEPRTWVVITGTNGKTTTTAMTTAMLLADGQAAQSVGNIGIALQDALSAPERIDVLVAELSSFQLHWAPELRPQAGALLNLAEDHLDWHGSMENYAVDKARALTGEIAVVGIDDAVVKKQLAQVYPQQSAVPARLVPFTLGEPEAGEFGVRDGMLVDNCFGDNVALAPATGISPAGPAGVLDALAAAALARSQGASAEAIATALREFTVQPHRGQVVHEAGQVKWVDDSKATNPHAADAALRGHDSVVWVAGGQLKGAAVDELITQHKHRMRAAIVLGADRQLLADAFARSAPDIPLTVLDNTDPDTVMSDVAAAAVAVAQPGDVVLLAPAAASLDMFSGMAARGDRFAGAAVAATPGQKG